MFHRPRISNVTDIKAEPLLLLSIFHTTDLEERCVSTSLEIYFSFFPLFLFLKEVLKLKERDSVGSAHSVCSHQKGQWEFGKTTERVLSEQCKIVSMK